MPVGMERLKFRLSGPRAADYAHEAQKRNITPEALTAAVLEAIAKNGRYREVIGAR